MKQPNDRSKDARKNGGMEEERAGKKKRSHVNMQVFGMTAIFYGRHASDVRPTLLHEFTNCKKKIRGG